MAQKPWLMQPVNNDPEMYLGVKQSGEPQIAVLATA